MVEAQAKQGAHDLSQSDMPQKIEGVSQATEDATNEIFAAASEEFRNDTGE